MATQRPAGVIKDNLRANTNLRVALRMADETDSNDVIGTKDASLFDPGTPGRGIAKTGPGRMTLFQSAYAGGWSLGESDGVDVAIASFGTTDQGPWELPIDENAVVVDEDLGPERSAAARQHHGARRSGGPGREAASAVARRAGAHVRPTQAAAAHGRCPAARRRRPAGAPGAGCRSISCPTPRATW